MFDSTEILVVAALIAGEEHAKRVMEIIAPLRVQPIAAQFSGTDEAGVIGGAFRNDIDLPVQAFCPLVNRVGGFFEKGSR